MALYQQPVNNNLQYTLNTQLAQGGTTAVLSSSVAGIVQAPGVFVVDRVDSAGNKTASVREYISFTGVSGANLTGLSKGLAGSTDQAHNVGAIVEFVPDVTWANALYSAVTLEHGVTGQHTSLASVSNIVTQGLAVQSLASIQQARIQNLFLNGVLSLASINNLTVSNTLIASGASLQGFSIRPVWQFGGTVSGATAALCFPLVMDRAGTIIQMDAMTRIGASAASLAIDITKNGVSILGATASTSYLTIPTNGTFASATMSNASAAISQFVPGDIFNISSLTSGSMAQDLIVKFHAR